MAQGRATDKDKVARVLADLYLGADSQAQIAQKNEISEGNVANIKRRHFEDFERLKNRVPRFADIDTLAAGLLEQSLVTLTVQLEHFGNTEWLETQPAGELANLHGVINDKTIRLLAARQNADERRLAEADVCRPADTDEGQAAGCADAECSPGEVP